jgi:hypothetical protein
MCSPRFETSATSANASVQPSNAFERTILLGCLFVLAVSSNAADAIPPYLVGVWATKKAVLRGEALFEGQGLYLDTDGVGAVIGGPPPIGVRIVATYDSSTNVIAVQMTEHGKTVGNATLKYDPSRKIITDKQVEFHRRFDRLSPSIRKGLGLEAKLP